MEKSCKCGKPAEYKNGYCRDCRRQYNHDWYLKNKNSVIKRVNRDRDRRYKEVRDLINSTKSVPCKDCGKSYPPYVMDFDHRDRSEKKANISEMVSRDLSLDRIKAEISKCDVVCANCHRERTFGSSTTQ